MGRLERGHTGRPPGGRDRRARALAGLAVAALVLGCAPTMIERDGRRVFNPAYLEYLDSPHRDRWQQPEAVLDALAIPEGAVAADIGAGSGYFSERLADRVGPDGLVYATDVQDEMIAALEARVTERGLSNVRVVRAGYDDPTLPDACCDLVLFSSVYKEIDDRVDYMRKLAHGLKPGARVAILEFRPEARGFGPPRAERIAAEAVERELRAAGYTLVESHDFLEREYLLLFTHVAAPSARATPEPPLVER